MKQGLSSGEITHLTLTSLSVASVVHLGVRIVHMIVTSRLTPRSFGQAVSAQLPHGTVVAHIGPEPDMVHSVEFVGKSKAAQLILTPGEEGEMSNQDLERVEGSAVGAEVDEAVQDGGSLAIDDFDDQGVDDGVAKGPAAVGVAEQVSFDQKRFFGVGGHEVGGRVVAQLEGEKFAAGSNRASIGDVAVDVARVEEADKQLYDVSVLGGKTDDRVVAGEVSVKDDRSGTNEVFVDEEDFILFVGKGKIATVKVVSDRV